jgi:hypothetical protein
MARPFPRPAPHPLEQSGFLLPLATTGALVLLLSSLSLQTAVLQSRRVLLLQAQRQHQEDQLTSAAHRLGAELTGPYRCLLALPSEQWPQAAAAAATAGCPAGVDPAGLLALLQQEHGVALSRWQPSPTGGELQLQLGANGPTASWGLSLAPTPSLRELG